MLTEKDQRILHIISKKKSGYDCTEEEAAAIKQWVKNELIYESWQWQCISDIQLLFPIEYGEAIDEQVN